MKYLLLLWIAVPFLAFPQKQKSGYAELSAMFGGGKYLSQSGLAGTFAVGFKPSLYNSLGAGFPILKFDGFRGISPVAFGEARGYFKSKASPFISLAAGKIFYNQTPSLINTTGGIYIAGGTGFSIPTKVRVKPFAMFRYAGYNFKTGKTNNNYGFGSLSFGAMF